MSTSQAQSTVEPTIIALPASVTIATVGQLAMDFGLIKFARDAAYVIDAARTETITTPGVQLILALAQTLQGNGASLLIKNQSPGFVEAFSNLGLQAQLIQLGGN